MNILNELKNVIDDLKGTHGGIFREEHKTFWIDLWNNEYRSNGETHGTFFAMCLGSGKEVVYKVAILVYKDLLFWNEGKVEFDT